jgi:hypothetical protein
VSDWEKGVGDQLLYGFHLVSLSSALKGTNTPQLPQAHVFISPNLRPKDKRAEIVLSPWGEQIANWIEGPRHHTASNNTNTDANQSLGL